MSRVALRGGGFALLSGGALQALGTVLHPDDTGATGYLFDARWAPAHVILATSYLLLVFGYVGLYLRLGPKAGPLASLGFVLAVTGSVLLVGVTFVEAFLRPVIAAGRPPIPLAAWLDPFGPLAGAVAVSLVALVCANLGGYVLGLALLRSGVAPRAAAYLLVVGTALSNGEFFGPLGFAIYVVGGVTLGMGLAWLGYATGA
jgi:hypothetical protein